MVDAAGDIGGCSRQHLLNSGCHLVEIGGVGDIFGGITVREGQPRLSLAFDWLDPAGDETPHGDRFTGDSCRL